MALMHGCEGGRVGRTKRSSEQRILIGREEGREGRMEEGRGGGRVGCNKGGGMKRGKEKGKMGGRK